VIIPPKKEGLFPNWGRVVFTKTLLGSGVGSVLALRHAPGARGRQAVWAAFCHSIPLRRGTTNYHRQGVMMTRPNALRLST
jgi:hypothetical protein